MAAVTITFVSKSCSGCLDHEELMCWWLNTIVYPITKLAVFLGISLPIATDQSFQN